MSRLQPLDQSDILIAIENIIKDGYPPREESSKYAVWYKRNLLPPKAIIRVAIQQSNKVKNYRFISQEANRKLLSDGFPVIDKTSSSAFCSTDLKTFSKLIERRNYDKNNAVDKNIALYLRENPWTRTKDWAEELEAKGWIIDGTKTWQIPHKGGASYKPYTWWRIYPKDYKSKLVCFTVGIDEDGSLLYKMDIQRDHDYFSKSPERINHFDQRRKQIGAGWQTISVQDADKYTLAQLADISDMFFQKHVEEYHKIVGELENFNPIKAVRICWNSKRWIKPSGREGKSVSNSFESDNGFGHDEWLFDLNSVYKSHCYARLENISKSQNNLKDSKIDLMLYTYNRSTQKNEWVGMINNVVVLSKEESTEVALSKIAKEWRTERLRQLKSLEDVVFKTYQKTELNDLYNIKFKPYDAQLFETPVPVEEDIGAINRYIVNDFSFEEKQKVIERTKQEEYLPTVGNESADENDTSTPNPTETITRKLNREETEYDNIHGLIQKELVIWLRNKGFKVDYEKSIENYNRRVDVVIRLPHNKKIFIEIKSYPNLNASIRSAMGQLLEYNYHVRADRAEKLIIVSHIETNEDVNDYLDTLRTKLGLNLYYIQYDLDKHELIDESNVLKLS